MCTAQQQQQQKLETDNHRRSLQVIFLLLNDQLVLVRTLTRRVYFNIDSIRNWGHDRDRNERVQRNINSLNSDEGVLSPTGLHISQICMQYIRSRICCTKFNRLIYLTHLYGTRSSP